MDQARQRVRVTVRLGCFLGRYDIPGLLVEPSADLCQVKEQNKMALSTSCWLFRFYEGISVRPRGMELQLMEVSVRTLVATQIDLCVLPMSPRGECCHSPYGRHKSQRTGLERFWCT